MVLVFDVKDDSDFLLDLLGDGKDSCFSCSDSLFGTANGHTGHLATFAVLVEVDLGPCGVLDFIDRSTALAQNSGDGSFGYSKFDDEVRFLLKLVSLFGWSLNFENALEKE